MKRITIVSLELQNFKGALHQNFRFDGASATVYGNNATGKTTLYDAFCWLLFGSDSEGQSNFDIKPLDSAGQVLDHGAITAVTAKLDVSGETRTLRRTYYEKWSRKRGSVNPTFDGNTSDYFVDEVPVKKRGFDEIVCGLVGDETAFRLLTDVRQFAGRTGWKQRRALLMDLCWNKSDADLMAQDTRFQPLLEAMEGRSLEDYRAVLIARRKNLSGTRSKIPIRLDELKQVLSKLPQGDERHIQAELAALNQKAEDLRAALHQDDAEARRSALERQRDDLAAQLRRLDCSNESYRAKQHRPNLPEMERYVRELEESVQEAKDTVVYAQREETACNQRLEQLREEYRAEKRTLFQGGTCPTCGQALPADQLAEAKANFQRRKERELERIQQLAAHCKEDLVRYQRQQKDGAERQQRQEQRLSHAKDVLTVAKEEAAKPLDALPGYAADRETLLRQQEQTAQALLELSLSAEQQETQKALQTVLSDIRQREGLLANLHTRERTERRMEELREEAKATGETLEVLDLQLELCEQFVREKVRLIDETVSDQFRLVRFKLFSEQVNGGLAECCEATVNGVPYASLNNGAQVNAGLDIIRTLSRAYDVAVPLFVDNAESVTEMESMDTQVIRLVVSEHDQELRVAG